MQIVVVNPANAVTIKSPPHYELPPGSKFRAAPLLAVADYRGGRLVALGQTRITARPGEQACFEVVVRALWHADDRRDGAASASPWARSEIGPDWKAVPDHAELAKVVQSEMAACTEEIYEGTTWRDADGLTTLIAKRLAERSRNHVAGLRALRYGIEAALGNLLRGDRTQDLELILAGIVEVSTMCGRASDEAREAAREGLWAWRNDFAAFHAYRRLADPTAASLRRARGGHRRSWFDNLVNGVRHCHQMESLADREIPLLQSLLNAASTIAVTRDARAQESFNLIASVGAVLFGIPALIVALYGADAVLPLSRANWMVLAPLAVAGFLAAVVAATLPARPGRRVLRFLATLSAAIAILAVLSFAGVLVQPSKN